MKNITLIITSLILYSGFINSQWIAQNTGTNLSINALDFVNENTGWAAGDNSKVYRTTNGGINWVIITIPGNPVNLTHLVSKELDKMFPGTKNMIFGTTNGGANWFSTFLGAHMELGAMTEYGGNLYAAAYEFNNAEDSILSARIMKSTNDGVNWVQTTSVAMNIPPPSNGMPNRISMNFVSNDTSYLATVKGLYITVNAGQTYSAMSNTPCCPHVLEKSGTIIESPSLYSGIKYPGKLEIYKSINAGETWVLSSVIPDPGNTKFFSGIKCPPNSEKIYLTIGNVNTDVNSVQDSSVYYSVDEGATWYYQSLPVSNTQVKSIDFVNENTGYIAGSNGTILKTTNGGGSPIGIQVISANIPEEFSLRQNYPNPFNPVTNIKFDITAKGYVRLAVYEISGREIEVLVSGELAHGSYNADWDASSYPSGVYFYRLETNGFIETRKMVLVK